MKVESPLELSVFNDRPSSSTDRVHFVFPFPGKLQAFCDLVGLDMIVEIPMDSAKLKFSQTILPEGDVSWNNEVDVILIPIMYPENWTGH